MKIREKLIQVCGGPYGQVGNAFAVRHDEGWILIDCGNPAAHGVITENLRYWGVDPAEITHVLLTHAHFDHAGTAREFREQGAKIVVGADDAPMLRCGGPGPDSPFVENIMPCCEPDVLIHGDEELCIGGVRVRALAMPGHTAGSLVYLTEVDGEQLLFSGDMFVCDGEHGDRAKPWWRGDMAYSAQQLSDSFARLWKMKLQPDIVAGGHGFARIGSGAKDMIGEAYRRFLEDHR